MSRSSPQPARTLLSTDALPVASVIVPRELTPPGAPEPVNIDPPVYSAAATTRRLLYVVGGLLAAWPLLGFVVMPALPPAHTETGVVVGLILTGVAIFGFIVFDHDRVFARRRRAGWLRALRRLGAEPDGGETITARFTHDGTRFEVELGTDEYGLERLWLGAVPGEGETRAGLTLQRRSTARRFWPTGDVDFDARIAVHGPFEPRVALLDAEARAAWRALIEERDVTVTEGRLFFSLAYAPRTGRASVIAELIRVLATHAACCLYRPDELDARLSRLTGPDEPPAVAANALRGLRAHAMASALTAEVQARLLAAPDPWRRVLAAEVAGHEDTLVELLAHTDIRVRARAVDALIELWPLDGLGDRLHLLLEHPEGGVRGSALTALGQRSLPLEEDYLMRAAADPDPRVGMGLLDWLHTATGPRAEAALGILLGHADAQVVHRAADRLGRVGGPDAELVLIDLTRNKAHRRAARNALLQLRQRYPKSLGGIKAIR